jgi:hypothetical protein
MGRAGEPFPQFHLENDRESFSKSQVILLKLEDFSFAISHGNLLRTLLIKSFGVDDLRIYQ